MQRQDEAVDLEEHLLFLHVGVELALGHRRLDRALHGRVPGAHGARERIAHRARAVVELDGARDVDAARVDLHRGALHPVGEERAQARQAAALVHRRVEHFLFEAVVVFADDADLQLLARAEMREDAAFAHLHAFREQPDGQAFEPVAGRQFQCGIQNCHARHFPLAHRRGGRGSGGFETG